jgi:hypothetical protein
MLFARAMSLGQRIYCPDLTSSTVYVDTLGESEVPMYDITPTPADVPRPTPAQASLPAAAPLFGALPAPAGPADWALAWAHDDMGLTGEQAEAALTKVCKANGGDFMFAPFRDEVETVAGGQG